MLRNTTLKEALYYLHISELNDWCEKLSLSAKGKKVELVFRIVNYIKTGKKSVVPRYPEISCTKKGKTEQRLSPNRLMLKGAYKNDLKTRIFFKDLIGIHFHFTAFGIDWLEHRWMAALPPTYQEFATMWQSEYVARQKIPAMPKTEWAYITFVQKYLQQNSSATRDDILENWHTKRHQYKNYVDQFLALESIKWSLSNCN